MRKLIAACMVAALSIIVLLSGCTPQTPDRSASADAQVMQTTEDTADMDTGTADGGWTTPTLSRPVSGEVILEEKIPFTEFPLAKKIDLAERTRYDIYFETNHPIKFVVYSEKRYSEWLETGYHTMSKVTTKSGPKCCDTSMSTSIDINIGEGGTYYLVFDASDLKMADPKPTEGIIRITKMSEI
ncbi:MAG: hypothetical protein V1729_03325 [Candidatus Woesearchaeota archaeon]